MTNPLSSLNHGLSEELNKLTRHLAQHIELFTQPMVQATQRVGHTAISCLYT